MLAVRKWSRRVWCQYWVRIGASGHGVEWCLHNHSVTVSTSARLQGPNIWTGVCVLQFLCFSAGSSPVVNECDGEYNYDPRKNLLHWTFPVIDSSNTSGVLEFSATALPGDFFPLSVDFVSKRPYADLKVNLFHNTGCFKMSIRILRLFSIY